MPSSFKITAGEPDEATVIDTPVPQLVFNRKADKDYTILIRYLTSNTALDVDGTTVQSTFTAVDQLPILPQKYHYLLYLLTGKMISQWLAGIVNEDGSLRYPGMERAYQFFSAEYLTQLQKDKRHSNKKPISRRPASFRFAGAEFFINQRGFTYGY